MDFKFNERKLRRTVAKKADAVVADRAKKAQRSIDRLQRSHRGRPASQIMSALRSAFRSAGLSPKDGQLRPLAEAISAGEDARIEARKGRW